MRRAGSTVFIREDRYPRRSHRSGRDIPARSRVSRAEP
jgi:hypothetical protein